MEPRKQRTDKTILLLSTIATIIILSTLTAPELLVLKSEGSKETPRGSPTTKSKEAEFPTHFDGYCLNGGTCSYIPHGSVAAGACDNANAGRSCENYN